MWDTNGRKIKRKLVKIQWKRKATNQKLQKAIDWYMLILKKQAKQWETNWVKDAKQKALARIKRYGIADYQIKEVFERRGMLDLLSKEVK